MNFFKSLSERIKNMFNFTSEEKIKIEDKQIFCPRDRKFVYENDCVSSILSAKDRKDIQICREECECGVALRASCPFDKKMREKEKMDIPETPVTAVKILTLGERIRAAREALNLTQKQVANMKEATFSNRSLSRWEHDGAKISEPNKKSLMVILNLPSDFFD